jgi:hypothetical protein
MPVWSRACLGLTASPLVETSVALGAYKHIKQGCLASFRRLQVLDGLSVGMNGGYMHCPQDCKSNAQVWSADAPALVGRVWPIGRPGRPGANFSRSRNLPPPSCSTLHPA